MKRVFKWSEVAAFRLTRHHLAGQNSANFVTICQNICGVQAQLMAAAEMQLWARRHNLTRAEIHSALWRSRDLVKTSLMRQTLHLMPAADFSIYINALRRSRLEALRKIMSRFGITQKEAEALTQSIIGALQTGPMTQPELTEQIRPKTGKKLRKYMELVWGIQIFRLALIEGLICYGPERGKKATFIRVDQWLPKQKVIVAAAAKQILLRRYLQAYGPATLQDFSKWAGFSTKEAGETWELLRDELLEIDIEDKPVFILRSDYDQLANSNLGCQALRLLPHFDPYLLAHADKNHLVSSPHYKRVYRNQGWISPVILLDGRVIGVWSYTRRAKRWLLEIEPFEKFSKAIREQIEKETASLGGFLGTAWEIKYRNQ